MFLSQGKGPIKLVIGAAAAMLLSGCYSGFGTSYDDVGYSAYDCDPYTAYDDYYACDRSYGFYNIGFGGGWWNDYYYPGYGVYIFDRGGHRHRMGQRYRRYWGGRRHAWLRDRRYRRGDRRRAHRGRYHREGRGAIAMPENRGHRVIERSGRRNRDDVIGPGEDYRDGTRRRGRRSEDGVRRGGRGEGRVARRGERRGERSGRRGNRGNRGAATNTNNGNGVAATRNSGNRSTATSTSRSGNPRVSRPNRSIRSAPVRRSSRPSGRATGRSNYRIP